MLVEKYNHKIPQNVYFCFSRLMCLCVRKVPKSCDGQQNSENQKVLPDVAASKKQVSYKTEIIGGVPIVTQTQVNTSDNLYHLK